MSESIAYKRSYAFGVRVVELYRTLRKRGVEWELLSQLLRAGTSISANLAEAQYAQSTADFVSKIRIALKEAAEARTWLRLIHDVGSMGETEFAPMDAECTEILKMLAATIRSIQGKP